MPTWVYSSSGSSFQSRATTDDTSSPATLLVERVLARTGRAVCSPSVAPGSTQNRQDIQQYSKRGLFIFHEKKTKPHKMRGTFFLLIVFSRPPEKANYYTAAAVAVFYDSNNPDRGRRFQELRVTRSPRLPGRLVLCACPGRAGSGATIYNEHFAVLAFFNASECLGTLLSWKRRPTIRSDYFYFQEKRRTWWAEGAGFGGSLLSGAKLDRPVPNLSHEALQVLVGFGLSSASTRAQLSATDVRVLFNSLDAIARRPLGHLWKKKRGRLASRDGKLKGIIARVRRSDTGRTIIV